MFEALGAYQEQLEKSLLDAATELEKASSIGYGPINRDWIEEALDKLQSILERQNEQS